VPVTDLTMLLLGVVGLILVHEAGHAGAAQALGLPWRATFSRRGPGIRIGSDSLRLTRRQVIVTAAAGPLVSLACGIAIWKLLPFLALSSFELALWNLVLPQSDGAKILRVLRGRDYWR
jgi:stage IV sporulation protein FB